MGFSKWTVLIGRTGFGTISSISDPTLSLIDRRFANLSTHSEMLGGAQAREENATVIRNLHRGGAECRAGGSDTACASQA